MEEIKRYRNAFIILTLMSVLGIMIGLYLYEYTNFFSALRADAELTTSSDFNSEQLLSLFFNEVRILAVLFMFGFTLFAPYTAAAILIYKGFIVGFSSLYFGIYYRNKNIDRRTFILVCTSMIFLLTVYIITGAKSMAFSGSLRYAAPDLPSLLKRKTTGRYMVTFLLLCVFLFISVALKYTVTLI